MPSGSDVVYLSFCPLEQNAEEEQDHVLLDFLEHAADQKARVRLGGKEGRGGFLDLFIRRPVLLDFLEREEMKGGEGTIGEGGKGR